MRRTRIVIFAKAPVPGKAKTRLIPALGEIGAARLAHRMLLKTVEEAQAAALAIPELCATPHPYDPDWAPFLPKAQLRFTDQGQGDLGERLAQAAKRTILLGESVLLIGTDCPALDRLRLRAAAAALANQDAFLYPATDGGYVLLGLSRFDPSLFEGIGWSGPEVAADTIARIQALGWTFSIGDVLADIDEPADLAAAEDLL
jgi:rSAM/selenodomain-associated transferase 1